MAYTGDEKSTGLDVLSSLATDDVIIVGDVSDNGRAKAITSGDLTTEITTTINTTIGGFNTVKARSSDTTSGYLDDKITLTSNDGSVTITKSIVNPGANEEISYNLASQGGGGGGGGTKLAIDTTTHTVTGTTVETTLYTQTIPAGLLGTNDAIEADVIFSTMSIAASQSATFKVKFGGTTIVTLTASGAISALDASIKGKIIANASSSAQIAQFQLFVDGKSVATKYAAIALDTTIDQDFVVTGKLSLSSDTLTAKGLVLTEITEGLGDGVIILAEAANDLSTGDAVGVSDIVGGTVDLFSRSNKSLGISNFTAAPEQGVEIATDKVAILYEDSVSGDLKVVVVNTSNSGMTFTAGTPVTVVASGSFDVDNHSICQIGTNKFGIAYSLSSQVFVKIATVSGTVPTLGSAVGAYTDTSQFLNVKIVKVDTDKILVASNGDTHSNYIVATISGTVPTFGTKQTDSHYVIVGIHGGGWKFIQTGVGSVFQIGQSTVDTGSPFASPIGSRILSISGTVITFNTLLETSTDSSGSFSGGNISLITATQVATVFGYTNSGANPTGSFLIFSEFSGTSVTNQVDIQLGGTSGGTATGALWVTGGKVYLYQDHSDSGNGYNVARAYTYNGGVSYTLDFEDATASAQFSYSVIPVDDYLIAIPNNTQYIMSGIATTVSLGFIVEDVIAGNTALVLISGQDTNQSGLQPGKMYVMSTNGSLVQGTNFSTYAGRALSDTNIVR